MSKLINKYITTFAAALSLALWSCDDNSPSTDLLSSVPADAMVVAKTDFLNIITEAGCLPTNGRYMLTPAIESLLESSDTSTQTLVTLLADLAPEVDLTSVVWYLYTENSQPVIIAGAKDTEALMARLAHSSTASVKISDYNVYTFDGACVIVRDRLLWIARSADHVIDINEIAAKKSFSTNTAKVKSLNSSGDIVAVVSGVKTSIPGLEIPEESFATISARCLRSGFNLHISLSAPDGKSVEIGSGMEYIEPSFVSLMPRQTAACIAVGNLDWHMIYPAVAGAFDGGGGVILPMLRPYIEAIDGTVAVAVAPAAGMQSLGNFDLSTWEVFFAASMPQEKLDQFTTLISALSTMSDIPCRANDNGTYTLQLPDGIAITIGNINGSLVIANYDLSVAGAQKFSTSFDNKVLAMDIDIPYNGELARTLGLPWGISVDAGVGSGSFDAMIKLNGIKTTPLKALIEYLAK